MRIGYLRLSIIWDTNSSEYDRIYEYSHHSIQFDIIRVMGIKDFFLKQVLKHKMKDVPPAQRDMMMKVMEENPDFFKKVGDEVQRRVKNGESEMAATMTVMRQHQAELQKIMRS